MVSLCYATLAQIAAELRRRVYGEKAKLATAMPMSWPKPTDRPNRLATVAEELQKLADEEVLWQKSCKNSPMKRSDA